MNCGRFLCDFAIIIGYSRIRKAMRANVQLELSAPDAGGEQGPRELLIERRLSVQVSNSARSRRRKFSLLHCNSCFSLLHRWTLLFFVFAQSPYSQYISCVVLTKALTRNTIVLSAQNKFELSAHWRLFDFSNDAVFLSYLYMSLKETMCWTTFIRDRNWQIL